MLTHLLHFLPSHAQSIKIRRRTHTHVPKQQAKNSHLQAFCADFLNLSNRQKRKRKQKLEQKRKETDGNLFEHPVIVVMK
jgi:hypothetical protein